MKDTSEKKTEVKHLPNSDLLQSQTNVEEKENNSTSSELIIREKIEGTPFTLIKLESTGWFLTLGKYRMSEPVDNKEELIQKVIDKDWNLILDTICTLTEDVPK